MITYPRVVSFLIKAASGQTSRKVSTSPPLSNITLKYNPNGVINKNIINKYWDIPLPECITMAKYVWIDGTGENLRSKTRTLDFIPKCVEEIPIWTYDGSCTYQAETEDSEVYLCPRVMYNDPIRMGHNLLVLCDTYTSEHKPTKSNYRASCVEAMDSVVDHEPWFGIEQEYIMIDVDGRPFGWPSFGFPNPPGKNYCGVGANRVVAREVVEAHYRCCLYAGIDLYGANAEAMPAQWEYQLGPSLGMKLADDAWMARFLLQRISEEYGIAITFNPKLLPNWFGSGAHLNFSTKKMRCDGGLKEVERVIGKLAVKHKEHLTKYDAHGGKDNFKRLTGSHETSSFDKFTSAIAHRGTSVRIPRTTADDKKGHFEDRRPAANCDPYRVCEAIVKTCLLDK